VEIFEEGLAVVRQIRCNCEVALLCKKRQHEAPLQGLLPSGTRNMGRPRPPRPLYPGKDGDRLLQFRKDPTIPCVVKASLRSPLGSSAPSS
jgi:hypothetical protein